MPVRTLPSDRAFLLESANHALVLATDSEGRLIECYRGQRLPLATDYPQTENEVWMPAKLGGQEGRDNLNPFAYPSRNGAFFREPCLDGEFADGTRDLRLVLTGHTILEDGLLLQLVDPKGIEVRLTYRIFEALDLIRHSAEVENTGSNDYVLHNALTAATHVPSTPDLELIHLSGQWLNEFNRNREPMGVGKKTLESRRGSTSAQSNPFWAVARRQTGEETGEVWFGQIACSGNWTVVVERVHQGPSVVLAGRNHYDATETLAPGEAISLPSVITGYGRYGLGDMTRRLHGYQIHHLIPKPKAPRPVLYNSWEATYFAINESGQRALAERAAGVGVELFVLDDGWFSTRRDANSGLGDWWVAKEAFPDGLKPLAEYVRSLNMRFGLWFEPEMVNPDSDLFRQRPEWIYSFPDRTPTLRRHQLVLNCAREDVREYLLEKINALILEAGIEFIKWDMNRGITEAGRSDAPAGKERTLWQRHALGVYEMMDRLRSLHPGLEIESCASGGSRVDIGMMERTDQFLPSDNTDAFDRLFIQDGFSLAYTPKTMMSWVTGSPNWLTKRDASLRFRFHVAMAGALGLSLPLDRLDDTEIEECADWIRIYKEIRETVQTGSLYRILPPSRGEPCALEYVNPEKSAAIVFGYWPMRSWREPAVPLALRGLSSEKSYCCQRLERPNAQFDDPNHGKRKSGLAWREAGLPLDLQGDYASVIYSLRIVDTGKTSGT